MLYGETLIELLNMANEYVTRQFKICCRGENDTFSNFNTYFRINLFFLIKSLRYVEGRCPGYRMALPDF